MPVEIRMVLDSIRHIVQLLRVSSRIVEGRIGVSNAQLFVLRVLADQEALSLNEIANRTLTHQSSVSLVVSKLVARRLVRRRRSSADGRRLELRLSAAGRALLQRAPEAFQERLIDALMKLSDRDRRALALALGRLLHAIGVGKAAAPMLFEDERSPGRT